MPGFSPSVFLFSFFFSSFFFIFTEVPLKPTFVGVIRGRKEFFMPVSTLWNNFTNHIVNHTANQVSKTDYALPNAEAFWNKLDASQDSNNNRTGFLGFTNQESNNDRNGFFGLTIDSLINPGNKPSNDAPVIAPVHNPSTGKDWEDTGVQPQVFDFLNADLAKHYGMSKTTAYQEALANTSYQRAVKDMQAAGLNPASLFGSGKGGPAGSSVYASSPSGGSSGRSYGSKSSSDDKLFDSGVYGSLSAIGGLVGIAATGRPDGYWIGSAVSQGAMQLMNYVDKIMNRSK